MEASLKTNGFSFCQKVFSDVITKEVTQDMVVSDTMPDIASIVTAEGIPMIRSKDVSDGRIRVEANIPVRASYLAEESGELRYLDLNLPISVSAESADVKDGCVCTVTLSMKALDARMLNSRKISVCAVMEIRLDCYQNREAVYYTADDEKSPYVHVLQREQPISVVCCVTEKTFALTDEYILPQGATPASLLLGENVDLTVEEAKAVGSKLILKGSARSRVLYCSDSGQIDTAEFTTGFSQIVDTDCETENALPLTELLLSGMYYDVEPGFDGRTIKMELHAVAQLRLLRTEKVPYIADAYSNTYVLEPVTEERKGEYLGRDLQLRDTLRLQQELPLPAAEITSCHAAIQSAEQVGNAVKVNMLVRLCGRDENGTQIVFRKAVAGEIPVELSENERLLLRTAAVTEQYAAPSGSGAELRIGLEIGATVLHGFTFSYISGFKYDELQMLDLSRTPSLVIMKASGSDCLWQIARDNLSTVDAIIAANDLENAGENWEKLLLIPRTS